MRTPGARARLDSCIRTLMVSKAGSDSSRGNYTCCKRITYLEDGKRAPPSYRHPHRLRNHVSYCQLSRIPSTPRSHSLPIRLVAADAGFLPPGPCTDFADMLYSIDVYWRSRNSCRCAHSVQRVSKIQARGVKRISKLKARAEPYPKFRQGSRNAFGEPRLVSSKVARERKEVCKSKSRQMGVSGKK